MAAATATPQELLAESGLVTALYGEEGAAAQAAGQVSALSTEAAGTQAEAAQYGVAGQIAGANAQTALVSGQIQQYQNTRQLMNTLGAQAADVSGAGFQNSGSAIALARSSLQQGLIQNQVIGTNAQLESGGYLEQAAASSAEQQAAIAAANTESAQSAAAANVENIDTNAEKQVTAMLSGLPGLSVNNGNVTVNNTGSGSGGKLPSSFGSSGLGNFNGAGL